MAQPFVAVSIVTVVRNDPGRLGRTLASVSRHKGPEVEYVVVDGASTDATLELIRAHEGVVDRWISEPDAGIYDAMNKAVPLCRGRFVMFLNAGDELLVDVGALVQGIPEGCVIQYGKANMLNPDGSLSYVKGKRLRSARRFLKGMPLCHQAILYCRELMPSYDTSFRIMSDRLLSYRLIEQFGLARTRFHDIVLVNYYEDGFSNSVSQGEWREEQERFYRVVGKEHYIAIKRFNGWFKRYLKLPMQWVFGRVPRR